METITLKIDKRTKAGKAFLSILDILLESGKGIDVMKEEYPVSKNIPNTETKRILEENSKKNPKDLKEFDTVDELFDDLGV